MESNNTDQPGTWTSVDLVACPTGKTVHAFPARSRAPESAFCFVARIDNSGFVCSGFGAGFERLVCYTTGMDNIRSASFCLSPELHFGTILLSSSDFTQSFTHRDAIPFPRYPGKADY